MLQIPSNSEFVLHNSVIFITFSLENIVCPDPQGHQLIYLNTEFITCPSGSQQKILSVEKRKGVDSGSQYLS